MDKKWAPLTRGGYIVHAIYTQNGGNSMFPIHGAIKMSEKHEPILARWRANGSGSVDPKTHHPYDLMPYPVVDICPTGVVMQAYHECHGTCCDKVTKAITAYLHNCEILPPTNKIVGL